MKTFIDITGPELEQRLQQLTQQLENTENVALKSAWDLCQEATFLEEAAQRLESDQHEYSILLREKSRSQFSRLVQEKYQQDPQIDPLIQERLREIKEQISISSTRNIKTQLKSFYRHQDECHWFVRVLERSQGILPDDPVNLIESEMSEIDRQIKNLTKDGWDTLQINRVRVMTQESLYIRQINSYLHLLDREKNHEQTAEGLWAMFERAHTLLRHTDFVLKEESLPPEKRTILEQKKEELLRIKNDLLTLMKQQSSDDKEFWLNAFYEFCSSTQTRIEQESLPRAIHLLEQVPQKLEAVTQLIPQEKESFHQKKLQRWQKYFRAETMEKKLQHRLETIFGHRFVEFFDNLILFLIIAVIALLCFEWWHTDHFRTNPQHLFWFVLVDTSICGIFLLDFFTKLFLSSDKWLYFRRHALFDFLPSIPFGLLHLHEATLIRFGRLARFFRLLRIAQPIIRLARVFFLMIRVIDRIVKRYGTLLNQNIVLFEQENINLDVEKTTLNQIYDCQNKLTRRIRNSYEVLSGEEQRDLLLWRLEELDILLEKTRLGTNEYKSPLDQFKAVGKSRDISLDYLIAELIRLDEHKVEDFLDRDIIRSLGGYLRYFNIPLIRSLPIIRSITRDMKKKTNAEILARTGRVLGQILEKGLNAVYFVADFRGIVTPQQLLDRVGRTLVNSTKQPAVRLVFLGATFIAIQGLVEYFDLFFLIRIMDFLSRTLGTPVIILGSLCIIPLVIGVWFTAIAGQASFFYHKVAEAQYINLLKEIKMKNWKKDVDFFYQRVLLEEGYKGKDPAMKSEFIRHLKYNANLDISEEEPFPIWSEEEMAMLLLCDYLDGAVFYHSDTKTSEQLIGNLVIDGIKRDRLRYSKKSLKRIDKLDMSGNIKRFFGPQMCFSFITDSIAQRAARLLVEYNSHCISKKWLSELNPSEKEALQNWIQYKKREFIQEEITKKKEKVPDGVYQSTDFNAMHFLMIDSARDRYIEERFGEEILALMKVDRKSIFRNIFGTYPLHLLPKDIRTFNLYQFYQEYLARGQFVLTPFFLVRGAFKLFKLLLKTLYKSARIILNPDLDDPLMRENRAGFQVGIRHINRMRKPVFMEALKMRCLFDYEFLGLSTPGYPSTLYSYFMDDLDFIRATAPERRYFLDLLKDRENKMSHFIRFLRKERLDGEYFIEFLSQFNDPEKHLIQEQDRVMRALCTAYVIDYRNLATHYEAYAEVQHFFDSYFSEFNLTKTRRHREKPPLFISQKKKALFEQCLAQTTHKNLSDAERYSCMEVFLEDKKLTQQAKIMIHSGGRKAVLEQIREIVQHWVLWKQQLVCIRAVQTLAVMDVRNYRNTLYMVGDYENEPLPKERTKTSMILKEAFATPEPTP